MLGPLSWKDKSLAFSVFNYSYSGVVIFPGFIRYILSYST